jgi:hypothetical protein
MIKLYYTLIKEKVIIIIIIIITTIDDRYKNMINIKSNVILYASIYIYVDILYMKHIKTYFDYKYLPISATRSSIKFCLVSMLRECFSNDTIFMRNNA